MSRNEAKENTNDTDGFIDSIYESVPEHSMPVSLKYDFKPWHKPRKQWLRKNQWLKEIKKLQEVIQFTIHRPLRYMSLPGTDFLDVRYIYKWCQENMVPLKFLGYNDPTHSDPNQTELNLSLSELTQREYVDKNSDVVTDRLERISSKTSVAYQRMKENGPFDIINLDLCNSIAACVPQEKQDDYYQAILEIISFQKSSRAEPWLLFITTRTNRMSINPTAGNRLFSCIESNVAMNPDFKNKIMDDLRIDFDKVQEIYRTGTTTGISNAAFHSLFGLGFSKWLLKLLFSGAPKWKIELLPSYDYLVDGARTVPDMISLGFLCSMVIERPIDDAGLTPPADCAMSNELSEPEIAIELVKSLAQVTNVDTLLTNATIKTMMIEEAALLMTDARYDGAKYKIWAAAI